MLPPMKTRKKWLIASLIVFALFNVAYASTQGKVTEQRTVKSSILSRDVKYTVYLPADYESSERTYPVVICFMVILTTIPAGFSLER